MAKNKYLEIKFPIQCCGRNNDGEEVLDEPVSAEVEVHQRIGDEKNISLLVMCPHNYGGHGEYCKASQPVRRQGIGVGKKSIIVGKVYCPYSCDIPYCFDLIRK